MATNKFIRTIRLCGRSELWLAAERWRDMSLEEMDDVVGRGERVGKWDLINQHNYV